MRRRTARAVRAPAVVVRVPSPPTAPGRICVFPDLAPDLTKMGAEARLPMTPEEYAKWRRQLWTQRGPNVVTPTYNELLPCYKAALERCREQVGEREPTTPVSPSDARPSLLLYAPLVRPVAEYRSW